MWDGAINHIEVQALAPISHEDEMGEEVGAVLLKLQSDPNYPVLFVQAFGDSVISSQNMLKAMAEFQLTFVSANSKYDRVLAGKDHFSEQEEKGYQIFQSKCSSCHTEPLFTNGYFENNGLPVDPNLNDMGRFGITKRSSDSLKFKVPSLRNIEFSQPYMHDGRFKTIEQVVDFYSDSVQNNRNVDVLMKKANSGGLGLNKSEKEALIAFMLTMTDSSFINDRTLVP